MYPVEIEVTDDVGDHMAKFTAFDDESFMVKIDGIILSPQDLREIADKLEEAMKMLKDGA